MPLRRSAVDIALNRVLCRLRQPLQRFGATLRQYRKQRRLSQRALAASTGIRNRYISDIERGLHNIAVLMLLRLAYALEIPTACLLARLDTRITLAPLAAGDPLTPRYTPHVVGSYEATPPIPRGDPATLLRLLGATLRQYRQNQALSQPALTILRQPHPMPHKLLDLDVHSNEKVPVRRGPLAVLRVSSVPAGRTRDALDEGSDLVITDDPAVLEYAGTRPGYVDVALDWNRTYVLLAPGHPEGLADIKRESLRDAVHLDARPAEWEGGRFWLAELQACGFPTTRDTAVSGPRRQRVVYDQSGCLRW